MRNIGSSIGISLMSYLLVRNAATEQARPWSSMSPPYRQVGA